MAADIIQTSVCNVSVNQRVRGGPGPAVLCVRGIWAPRDYLNELFEAFPEEDIVIGDIPGMWTPAPTPSTPAVFAKAYDEVVVRLFPNRPVVVLGVSTGALITLGMRAPDIRAQVAVEPFLSTADVWPLVDSMRERMRGYPITVPYIKELFGIAPDALDELDFSPLLNGTSTPLYSIVGKVPLGQRRELQGGWPSFASQATRERLAALGKVYEGPTGSGHNITRDVAGWALTAQVLRQALHAAGAT